MPSKNKKWKELKALKKLKEKQKLQKDQTLDNSRKDREQRVQSGRKKRRIEGSQSKQAHSDHQRKHKKDSQHKMSLFGEELIGPSSGREQDDLSASGSSVWEEGRRTLGRGNPGRKPSRSFTRWDSPLNSMRSGLDHGRHFDPNGRDEQFGWSFTEVPGRLYTAFDPQWPDPHLSDPMTFSSRSWDGPMSRPQNHWYGSNPDLSGQQGQGNMPPPPARNSGVQNQKQNQDQFHWKRRDDTERDHLSSRNGSSSGSHARKSWDQNPVDNGSRWNRFARQFQDSHFHREDAGDRTGGEGSHSLASSQADSSGLDESSGSTGRKRGHSAEREKRLPKSSRAEASQSVGGSSTVSSSSTSKGPRDVSSERRSRLAETPDSASGKEKSHTPRVANQHLLPHPVAVTSTKSNGPTVKKKQFAESAKNLATGVHPRSLSKNAPSQSKPGEGVLERAERMCKELREKRKQAAQKQASLSGGQAETLRKALSNALHSVQSSQSSCVKDYLSDSNVPAAVGSSASGTQSTSGRASPASDHVSDIERLRHNIESSVLAEGRVSRPLRLPGSHPGTGTHARRSSTSSATVGSASSTAHGSNKPPLPQTLSKEALACMINSPQSRSQRVQLARMLRQHATTTTTRPRHSRLDLRIGGAENDAGDDSVEDILKDIGGLQELECLGDLRSVKMEDLTVEDKLRIAQLIEDADMNSGVEGNQETYTEVSASDSRVRSSDCSTGSLNHTRVRKTDVSTGALNHTRVKNDDIDTESLNHTRVRNANFKTSSPNRIGNVSVSHEEEVRTKTKDSNQKPDTSSMNVDLAADDVMEVDPLSSPPRQRSLSPQRGRSTSPNRPLSLDDLDVGNQDTTSAKQDFVVTSMLLSTKRDSAPAGKSPTRTARSQVQTSSAAMRTEPMTAQVDVSGVEDVVDIPASRNTERMDVVDELPSDRGADHDMGQGFQFRGASEMAGKSGTLRPLHNLFSVDANMDSTGSNASRQAGALHEVMGICQRQDAVLSEMRGIDVQLSQLYKSLIEIVARMSSLQRRRVQLQGEGEQLSQQRNSLLAGILPGCSASSKGGHHVSAPSEQRIKSGPSSLTTVSQHPQTATSVATSGLSNKPPGRERTSSGGKPPTEVPSVSGLLPQLTAPHLGAEVILPSWLTTPPTSQTVGQSERHDTAAPVPPESMQGSDLCLSGSVSSSVRSDTAVAFQQESAVLDQSGQNSKGSKQLSRWDVKHKTNSSDACLLGGILSQSSLPAASAGQSSGRPSSAREPRTMLSLGDIDSSTASKAGSGNTHGSKVLGASSVSSVLGEADGLARNKDSHFTESSSGIGSSVTGVSSTSHTQLNHDRSGQSDPSTLQPDSDQGTITSMSDTRHSSQQDHTDLNRGKSSGLSFDFTAPDNSGTKSHSSGVSVSYVGSISNSTTSDLVQQIVRNLPFTSQLGEVGSPRSMAMYLLKSPATENKSSSVDDLSKDRASSGPADEPPKARTRSVSLCDGSSLSDLGMNPLSSILPSTQLSGEQYGAEKVKDGTPATGHLSQHLSTSVPKLHLHCDADVGRPNVYTPRSESDGSSIVSSASLGEQIKFISERNGTVTGGSTARSLSSVSESKMSKAVNSSFAQLGFDDDILILENNDQKPIMPDSSIKGCSVILQKLDLESSTSHKFFKVPPEGEKPKKKMKSKKYRNKILQNRRQYFVDSSSEEVVSPADDDELPDLDRVPQQLSFQQIRVSDSGDRVLIEGENRDLDSTLVGEQDFQDIRDTEEDEENKPASSSTTGATRLRLAPDNLKEFRANVYRNLNQPSSPCMISSDSGAEVIEVQSLPGLRRKTFAVSGPCMPVMGLEVYRDQLYVCFSSEGVRSYSLSSAQEVAVFPVEFAQCCAVGPTCLAVGGLNQLVFFSLLDKKESGSIPTEVMVMCLLATETKLFVGLDCGTVIVVSFKTLQETQRFQAGDSAIHSMAWSREGSTRLLCVADQNANIHVLDAGSGLPVRTLIGHTKTAFSLCVTMTDHNDIVISGSGDRTVMAHDVHSTELVWKLDDHKGIVTSVCVDNGLLFSAGYDRVIRCYDLKSRKLLHLMYGAGNSIVMKMIIHNSVLYSGNREGQIEAVDLRNMGSFACGCDSCSLVFGIKEHLWHHLSADHLQSTRCSVMRCPWRGCFTMLNTDEPDREMSETHLKRHTESK